MKTKTNDNKGSRNILVPNDFSKLRPYCSERSIEYLKDSLKRLENGTDPTPSFPLYGKHDDSLLEDVLRIIEKSGSPDWLIEYEKSRVSKVGPQGGIPSWKDLEPLFLLYKTKCRNVSYVDEDIINEMKSDYKKLHCSELSATDAIDHLKRTNKIETRAAGWSEYQLKKTDPLAQKIAMKYVKNGDWKQGYGYVFSRYNKQKLRIFMPMPYSSMILQAKWYIPFLGNIQNSLLQTRELSPYTQWADKIGFDKCFDIMEKELTRAKLQSDEYIVYFMNDMEKMDTRTGSSQYEEFVLPTFHAAFGNTHMDEAVMFTTNAPIISPTGTMIGNHGTASGAEMTNGGETICNDYFQRRLNKLLFNKVKECRLMSRRANGDDSIEIFAVKKSFPFDKFQSVLKECLQQTCEETQFDVQIEKLDISTTFGKFCQNVLKYDPVTHTLFWCYPLTLVYNSQKNPEHEYRKSEWDKDYRDLDLIQKNDNGSRHPAFEPYTDWLMAGTKYPLLGKSEAETKRILSKYDRYRELQTLGERYNRQDYTITDSPTVRYILSKRR